MPLHSQAPTATSAPEQPLPASAPGVTPLGLADGALVETRPLERADRAALAAASQRLSERTWYLRFATPKSHLSQAELEWLTDVDHHEHEALLAIDPLTRRGVAVARYMQLPDEPGVVDVAVTVDDRWQRRGLGTSLLDRLIVRAREEGHDAVRATVLAENRASLAMLRHLGFRLRWRDGILREFELPLAAAATVGAE